MKTLKKLLSPSRKKVIASFVVIVAFLLGFILGDTHRVNDIDTHTERGIVSGSWYQVHSVIDGDTIKIDVEGELRSVRLIGVNTPELDDERAQTRCFSQKAKERAEELLLGERVRVDTDSSQGTYDRYQRILGYITREDGLFYNETIIKEGLAYEYTFNNPYIYQEDFKQAETFAKENENGFWNINFCKSEAL